MFDSARALIRITSGCDAPSRLKAPSETDFARRLNTCKMPQTCSILLKYGVLIGPLQPRGISWLTRMSCNKLPLAVFLISVCRVFIQ